MKWQGGTRPGAARPEDAPAGEIIEIGAVRLRGDGSLGERFHTLVRPRLYKKMNARVARITGISAAQLEDAPNFPEAARDFLSFVREGEGSVALLTWGQDDIPILRDNLRFHHIGEECLPPSFDLQKIWCAQVSGDNRQWSLSDALETLALPHEWTAHEALSDALSAALVAGKLDLAAGVASYPRGSIVLERRTVSGPRNARDLFETKEIASVACPACGVTGQLSGKDWVFKGGGIALAAYRCRCGREWFLRCRYHRSESGVYSATRSLSEPDNATRASLAHAREKAAQRIVRREARWGRKD